LKEKFINIFKIMKNCRIFYLERAADTQNSESSSTTPLPIGVGKNGILSLFTNCVSSFSAFAYAAP
jgi:hypothetical protein